MEDWNGGTERMGAEGYVWRRLQIVSQAREFLVRGGSAARRELVRTTIELDRLLREPDR